MDNNSDDFPPGVWRKNLLEQICQTSCGSEDGLLGCIRDALLLHPESIFNIAAKKSCHSGDDNRIYTTGRMANGSSDVSKCKKGVESNGSHHTNTDLWQLAFKDVIMSENFARLCKLVIQNFQVVKFDSFLDTNVMNERMKDGTYEKTEDTCVFPFRYAEGCRKWKKELDRGRIQYLCFSSVLRTM